MMILAVTVRAHETRSYDQTRECSKYSRSNEVFLLIVKVRFITLDVQRC